MSVKRDGTGVNEECDKVEKCTKYNDAMVRDGGCCNMEWDGWDGWCD